MNSAQIKDFFGLRRNVVVVSSANFLITLGEELWSRFMPKYLEALGASVLAIGLFGTLKDLLDALYQYPGGWLADRLGRKNALVLFSALALVGYAIYAIAPNHVFIFFGLFFAASWSSLALPATFAIIGDSLPKDMRTMGFTVQSILKRLPILVAPPIGGFLILKVGLVEGVKLALFVTISLTVVVILIQRRFYVEIIKKNQFGSGIAAQYRNMRRELKRLLFSDILIRLAEGIPQVFIVLYVLNVLGFNSLQFGSFIALQMLVSILVYIPAAKLSDKYGRRPFVVVTFIAFALFPLAVALASGAASLMLAFVVAGLRETGEPARKAMIVDLSPEESRGRQAGLYYLIRSFTVFPASFIGALLWSVSPQAPFFAAFAAGSIGTLAFLLGVREQQEQM